MADEKLESIAWLDNLSILSAELKKKTPPDEEKLAETLKIGQRMLAFYIAIYHCFDPAAIVKVRKAAKANPPYELSLNSARVLARRDGKVNDLPGKFHEALDVVITHRLIPLKIKGLVDHILSGKPAKEFDPTRVKKKTRSDKKPGIKEKTEAAQTVLDQRLEEATQAGEDTDVQTPKAAIDQGKAKFGWLDFVKGIWSIAILAFIVFFLKCAWHDFKTGESKRYLSDAKATPAVANNPSGSNEATNAEPTSIHNSSFKIQNSDAIASVAPVAWNASIESFTQLSNEFLPIPNYCLVKAILPPPMARMDEAMAVNLLSRLGDSSKYSVWYGNDSVTVESAVANPESLTLAFGGKDSVVLDWNGLKALHCDELQVVANHNLQIIYQCGLVSSQLEKAIEVECPSQDDFNNLVSALLYWGKTVAPSGLPYLHQGMVIENSGLVAVIWAGSPADQAGMKIDDAVWGVGQNGARKPKPIEVVNQLDALSPGKHELYVIRDAKVSPKTPRMRLEINVP